MEVMEVNVEYMLAMCVRCIVGSSERTGEIVLCLSPRSGVAYCSLFGGRQGGWSTVGWWVAELSVCCSW